MLLAVVGESIERKDIATVLRRGSDGVNCYKLPIVLPNVSSRFLLRCFQIKGFDCSSVSILDGVLRHE